MLRVTPSRDDRFWRVEDSLLDMGAVRTLAFLARNSHRYSERWKRQLVLYACAFVRLFLYATSPVLSCRVLHLMLRGMSQDRLDMLGQEYFDMFLKGRLKRSGLAGLQKAMRESEGSIVLVSQGLEHVVRPLAHYLGVERFIANRLDFRDGYATGRLLGPVVHSKGGIARLASRDSKGIVGLEDLAQDLGAEPRRVRSSIVEVHHRRLERRDAHVYFNASQHIERLSVVESLEDKELLLVGVTGFIGKVWLAQLLSDLPNIRRIHLLIRKQKSISAKRRFERMVSENPVFEPLIRLYGEQLSQYVSERVEIHEGDVSKPDLGLTPSAAERLKRRVDVVVNSGGLTDFNPDLRNAMSANVDSTAYMLDFIRESKKAALLHLSTCYVVGDQDGRILEVETKDYAPQGDAGFKAEDEIKRLKNHIQELESTHHGKSSARLRKALTEVGAHRAQELGWPNAYAFTKSLGESLIATRGADLPIAVVRPAIVETSLNQPFSGWNEGINTSAPLSYLLGTTFRQLPANERKNLDIIPVDVVCRGMTLVTAALIQRRHQRMYHMATSVTNPCDMRRSIELTSLAHRRYYLEQKGRRFWWKARMDAIPVSKTRYERLSAPRHMKILSRLRRMLSVFPVDLKPLERAELAVSRIAKLVEIYEPFILDNEHVFEAENINALSNALPADERATFCYNAMEIDWRDYWIRIHIPAMRKWCYPLIEGRRPNFVQNYPFHLLERTASSDDGHGPGQEAIGA